MTTWAEIAERCQNASGPDLSLSAEVMCLARGGASDPKSIQRGQYGWSAGCMIGDYPFPRWFTLPDYTGSVDAVLGLINASAPQAPIKTWSPNFVAAMRVGDKWGESAGATLPLALLAAFALAMQAEEGVKTVKEGAEA